MVMAVSFSLSVDRIYFNCGDKKKLNYEDNIATTLAS
jgi:hypothetical protein